MAWTNGDLAELTAQAIAWYVNNAHTRYCKHCSIVLIPEHEQYCVECYAELYADKMCDAMAEAYTQQYCCEKGLF